MARHAGHAYCTPSGLSEEANDRNEKHFLIGFERAALLVRHVMAEPPTYTTPRDYLENVADGVAHLLEDSDDLVSRALVVGCLSALGKS